jgi:hypothetical protein
MRRVPQGYVSPEAKAAVNIDLDALVSEFDAGYGRARLKKQCRVCDGDFRELVDALLARGAGVVSITNFLRDKKLFEVSESVIDRHKKIHFNAK